MNGEVAPKAAERIDSHLETCWPCGVKKDRWLGSISALMEYHDTVLGSNSESPPEVLSRFEVQLKGMASQTENSPLSFSVLDALASRRWPALSTKPAAGLAAVLLVGFLLFPMDFGFTSISEVLQRTREAETQRLQQVPGPVVYQELRVQRKSSTGNDELLTWQIWNDAKSGRSKQRVEDAQGHRLIHSQKHSASFGDAFTEAASLPPALAELWEVLRTNHLDPRSPLSAAGYEAWRQSIQHRTEEVYETTLPDGRAGLAIAIIPTDPVGVNGIARAELVVRNDIWHPVQQRLTVWNVQGLRDYELTETNFEVLALNSLSPSFFVDIAVSAPHLPLPKGPHVSPAPSLSPVELVSREIEAHYALHRLRACLGEPVEVKSDPTGGISVRGLLSSADRKEELVSALQSLSQVTVHIQTVEEALDSKPVLSESLTAQGEESETLSQTEAPVQVRSGESPIQDLLQRYFAKVSSTMTSESGGTGSTASVRHKLTDFSNRVAFLTQSALAEAWALRRLAEWYPAGKTGRLPFSTRWLLENMVQDHREELKDELNHWRALLEPLLLTIVGNQVASLDPGRVRAPGSGDLSDGGWAPESLELFQLVEQMERLTLGLLTVEGVPAQPPEAAEESARQLLAAFQQAEIELQELATVLGKEFSGNPKLLSGKDSHDGRRIR